MTLSAMLLSSRWRASPAPVKNIRDIGVYEDATAPYLDPQTVPTILFLADDCGLGDEIDYRWALSNHGRIPQKVWAKRWKRR